MKQKAKAREWWDVRDREGRVLCHVSPPNFVRVESEYWSKRGYELTHSREVLPKKRSVKK